MFILLQISNVHKRIFMIEFDIFVNNFKILRYNHQLSSADLVYILSLKSRSSVTNIESKRALPSLEFLVKISNLFAVKIDWLFGRSSQPYDEELILKLESQLMNIKITNDIEYKSILPDTYSDIEKRRIFYTLAERANLIFLLQYLKAIVLKEPNILQSRKYSNSTLDVLLENAGIKKNLKKEAAYRYNFIVSGIEKILQNKTRQQWKGPFYRGNPEPAEQLPKPLFDITKSLEN